ncbi:MAG TPA: beta-ketoacyl-[acyl-carrier-protein] synthase family protein [Thermoanaerobaculia bacterium]|nr:beta-ketoacyl-[acyl-carrier-protein] synthase family protein [Thermoanaerobaculia bacterium]
MPPSNVLASRSSIPVPASRRRVAITGIGLITPFGRGKEAVLESVRGARSGVRTIESIDASTLQCRIAGEVPAGAHEGLHRGHDRFTRFALIAADEAAAQAASADAFDPERVGVIIGTGLGGCETLDAGYRRMYRESQTRIPPASIAWSMYNAAASAVSTRHEAKGVAYSVVSACASGAHALGLAFAAIRSGEADAMFAGGADAPLTYGVIRAWESMRVLAIDNDRPERACRPFSADRQGLVLAEGAAVFFLETFESARARRRPVLGEIAGFGATSDAGHVTDPSADGEARAISLTLRSAGVEPERIGYINAHGTATRANDVTETRAIRAVFGEAAGRIPVSSTKSMHGHAMGASGAIETAISILSLNAGFIPPTLNLEQPDPECDLDYVPLVPRPARVEMFLSHSFGFGGMNAVLAVRTAVAADLLTDL